MHFCNNQTHGATYTIDAEWSSAELVAGVNWVLNIADASDALSSVVAEWNYRNLDEVPAFAVRSCRCRHRDLSLRPCRYVWLRGSSLTVRFLEYLTLTTLCLCCV